jgi:hypothetical protein
MRDGGTTTIVTAEGNIHSPVRSSTGTWKSESVTKLPEKDFVVTAEGDKTTLKPAKG